jgi:fluoride ion exporter CrcB/FEX
LATIGRLAIFQRTLLLVLIFLVVFVSYVHSPIMTGSDARWVIPTTLNIINKGSLELDDYSKLIKKNNNYAILTFNDHYYNYFPYGTSIIAIPFVWIAKCFMNESAIIQYHSQLERVIASFILALTAILIYSIACMQLEWPYALVIGFIFAFCTSAWSQASRELYQHGPSMLMLTVSLYLILRAERQPRLIQYVGAPLVMAYVIRPTNSLALCCFSLLVLFYHRQYFWRYLAWALLVAVPFVLINLVTYHALLPPYYSPGRIGLTDSFFEALLGNLISPARGLLVFSPIFLLVFFGIFLKITARRMHQVDYCLVAIIVLHWLAISAFPHWWAGHSYGPRLFADMVPFLVYFLIPVVGFLADAANPKWIWMAIFLALAVVSFWINFHGATSWRVYQWNIIPANVDTRPARIWDWHDLQFLR